MPQEFEKLPKDIIFDGIDKASKLIAVGLNQGRDAFVRLSKDETMKLGLDTIAVAIEKELERPRMSKEAIDAASHLMQGRENQFLAIDKENMKKALEASALMVENYKQSHVEKLNQQREAKSQGHNQGPTI